jgi:HSP20 family protein
MYRDSQYPFHQLRREMDRLLGGFFAPAAEALLPQVFRGQPAVNVWEQGDALQVEMEVPGAKNDQVDIAVANGELSIKIHRPEVEESDVTYHRRERPTGEISRVLRLPYEINAEQVQAELHDGLLRVTLPKAESAKPRKIKVSGV